jgi:hypothetical protein
MSSTEKMLALIQYPLGVSPTSVSICARVPISELRNPQQIPDYVPQRLADAISPSQMKTISSLSWWLAHISHTSEQGLLDSLSVLESSEDNHIVGDANSIFQSDVEWICGLAISFLSVVQVTKRSLFNLQSAFACRPMREWKDTSHRLWEIREELWKLMDAIEILLRYRHEISPAFLFSISPDSCERFLVDLCTTSVKKHDGNKEEHQNSVMDDIPELCNLLPGGKEALGAVYGRLLSLYLIDDKLGEARKLLERIWPEETTESQLKIGEAIRNFAEEAFYSASSCSGKEQGVCDALAVMALIPSPRPRILEEFKGRVEALVQLQDIWGVELVPLKISRRQDPVALLQMLLRQQPRAYLEWDQLQELATTLGMLPSRERIFLALLCSQASSLGDDEYALQFAIKLADSPRQPIRDAEPLVAASCKVVIRLLSSSMIISSELRRMLLSFVIVACPEHQLFDTLEAALPATKPGKQRSRHKCFSALDAQMLSARIFAAGNIEEVSAVLREHVDFLVEFPEARETVARSVHALNFNATTRVDSLKVGNKLLEVESSAQITSPQESRSISKLVSWLRSENFVVDKSEVHSAASKSTSTALPSTLALDDKQLQQDASYALETLFAAWFDLSPARRSDWATLVDQHAAVAWQLVQKDTSSPQIVKNAASWLVLESSPLSLDKWEWLKCQVTLSPEDMVTCVWEKALLAGAWKAIPKSIWASDDWIPNVLSSFTLRQYALSRALASLESLSKNDGYLVVKEIAGIYALAVRVNPAFSRADDHVAFLRSYLTRSHPARVDTLKKCGW